MRLHLTMNRGENANAHHEKYMFSACHPAIVEHLLS